jgi:hypothetical protein
MTTDVSRIVWGVRHWGPVAQPAHPPATTAGSRGNSPARLQPPCHSAHRVALRPNTAVSSRTSTTRIHRDALARVVHKRLLQHQSSRPKSIRSSAARPNPGSVQRKRAIPSCDNHGWPSPCTPSLGRHTNHHIHPPTTVLPTVFI